MYKSIALSSAIIAFGKAAGFAISFILAITMTIDDYAAFVNARNIILFFAPIALCGFNTSIVPLTADYTTKERFDPLRGLIFTAVGFCIVTSILLYIGLSVYAHVSTSLSPIIRMSTEVGAIGIVFFTLVLLLGQFSIAFDRPQLAFLSIYVAVSFGTIVVLGIAYAVMGQIDAPVSVWALIAGYAGAAAFQTGALVRHIPPQVLRARTAFDDLGSWLRRTLPLLLSTLASVVIGRFALLLLPRHATDAEVGLFGFLVILVFASRVVIEAGIGSVVTGIVREISRGALDAAAAKLRSFRLVSVGVTVAISLALMPLVGYLVSFFFETPFANYGTFALLLLEILVVSAGGPLERICFALGLQRDLIVVDVVSAVSAVAACLLLIPAWGLLGAAAALAIAAIVQQGSRIWLVHVKGRVPL